MLFSVIVPTCNRALLLKKCLLSILNQSIGPKQFEIIVIDDGSIDKTQELVEEIMKTQRNVIYHRINRQSPGAARNAGLKLARGDFIAFTDDDCVVEKDWLQKFKKSFEKHKVDAIGGSILNPTDSYLARSQHILNFSSWFASGRTKLIKDVVTANVCYRKESIKNRCFVEFPHTCVYEDSIFNWELIAEGKKILFSPDIRVYHHTWEHNASLHKFFFIQRKMAHGFVRGGFKVHGFIGKVLLRHPYLNLCCPRLIMVGLRCLKAGKGLLFLMSFPLLLIGEMYKGFCIAFAQDNHARPSPLATMGPTKLFQQKTNTPGQRPSMNTNP